MRSSAFFYFIFTVLLVALLGSISQHSHALGRKSEENRDIGTSYLLGVKSSLEKIFQDIDLLSGELDERAVFQAAQNEYEHLQIILFSQGRDLRNVKIEVTPLICEDQRGAIATDQISLYQVGYVETKKPAYVVEYIGWWPDPLLPLEQFDLPSGIVQPIWMTLYVPNETPSGHYRGQVHIIPENARAETLEVDLKIWNFALPEKSSLQAVFSLYEHHIQAYFQMDMLSPQLLRTYYDFLLGHRINPTNLYLRNQPQPKLQDFQYCIDHGMNAANICYLYDWDYNEGNKGLFSEEFLKNIDAALPQTISFLEERDWSDIAFIYGPDEPSPRHYDGIKMIFNHVTDLAPNIRKVLTEPPVKDLYDYVDIWVPKLDEYKERECRDRQEQGDEIWWYVCLSPQHPYPNFFIDYPAIDHRILFWMTWKYDITGFLYYTLNRWSTNFQTEDKRWPEVPWNTFTCENYNGDGQLIYPGPDGEPYTSLRFEVIRDGIEDYEYLHLLQLYMERLVSLQTDEKQKHLCRAENLVRTIDQTVVKSRTKYTKDHQKLLQYRRLLAEEIVRLKRIVSENSGDDLKEQS